MIPPIPDEEIEAEREARAYFHSLTRYNSTKAQRSAAHLVVFRFDMRRWSRAWRAHPIQPAARWSDVFDTAPTGWTYPGMRTLEDDEVDDLFPGARAAFATQCDDIPKSRFVFDSRQSKDGRLKLSVPMLGYGHHSNATWLPDMRIWRRYHRDVKSKPYRKLEDLESRTT